MICSKCGGTIHLNENCERCGIGYDELLDSIEHEEMENLFARIDDLLCKRKSIDIEASLLACELHNSFLIVPGFEVEGKRYPFIVFDDRNRAYITLFTDKKHYDSYVEFDAVPMFNSFDKVLDLMGDNIDGLVINPDDVTCQLEREFFERFFFDEKEEV